MATLAIIAQIRLLSFNATDPHKDHAAGGVVRHSHFTPLPWRRAGARKPAQMSAFGLFLYITALILITHNVTIY